MAQLASSTIYGDLLVTNKFNVLDSASFKDIYIKDSLFIDSSRNISVANVLASEAISAGGNLTTGANSIIESSSGNLTVRSRNGSGTLNLNGATFQVLSSGRLRSTLVSSSFIELSTGAANHIVRNLNADLLRGHTPETLLSPIYDNPIMDTIEVGVISGLEVNYTNNILSMSSGKIFIKGVGIIDVPNWSINVTTSNALVDKRAEDSCRWHALIIPTVSGEYLPGQDAEVTRGQAVLYAAQNPPGGEPWKDVDISFLTNPILVAKIRYVSRSETFSKSNIFPMRDLLPIFSTKSAIGFFNSDQKITEPGNAEDLQSTGKLWSLDTMGSYSPRPMISINQLGNLEVSGKVESDGDIITSGKISTSGGPAVDVSGRYSSWNKSFSEGHIHRTDVTLSSPGVNRRRVLFSTYKNLKEITAVYKNGLRLKEGAANDYTITTLTGQYMEVVFTDNIDPTDNIIIDIIEGLEV